MATPTGIDVVPGDSIQAAMDSACDGDEIVVHAGTYNEAVNFDGRQLRSAVSSTQPFNADPRISQGRRAEV